MSCAETSKLLDVSAAAEFCTATYAQHTQVRRNVQSGGRSSLVMQTPQLTSTETGGEWNLLDHLRRAKAIATGLHRRPAPQYQLVHIAAF
jgi:hypothetical protein